MRNPITNEMSRREFIEMLKKQLKNPKNPRHEREIRERLERERKWDEYKFDPEIVPFF